jgi:hypothetical protein
VTPYQKTLLEDIGGRDGYGKPKAAWRGHEEFFRDSTQKVPAGPLVLNLALTFIEQVYALVVTTRSIRVYRGYETAGLTAPFGKDHSSFIQGLVGQRHPGKPDGLWWTPSRPSMEIDNLLLSDLHRSEHRSNSAIKLEWNRLDYYLEGELPVGSSVYVGRAAPQQESAAYGGKSLGGGGFQFRLMNLPSHVKRYAVR